MGHPFNTELPAFKIKTGLPHNYADYIFARLVAKQTPEHILNRLKYKLSHIEKYLKNPHIIINTPTQKENYENMIQGGEKYVTIIRYMESLPDFDNLTI